VYDVDACINTPGRSRFLKTSGNYRVPTDTRQEKTKTGMIVHAWHETRDFYDDRNTVPRRRRNLGSRIIAIGNFYRARQRGQNYVRRTKESSAAISITITSCCPIVSCTMSCDFALLRGSPLQSRGCAIARYARAD